MDKFEAGVFFIVCFALGQFFGGILGTWIGDKIIEHRERKRMLKAREVQNG